MDEINLKRRTKLFALNIMSLVEKLPRNIQGRAIAGQLMRSGTSVAANYRAACRGRSKAEFISRLGTVEEEADESAFWLELIIEGKLLEKRQMEPLLKESYEITAIIVASIKSARKRMPQSKIQNPKSKISSR